MPRIAIFDCPLGIAGDMTVGALLDAGMPFELLKQELKNLHLTGYALALKKVRSGAFRAAKFEVKIKTHRHHHHISLREIEKQIQKSKLQPAIKQKAIAIFRNLGRAEARVHGIPIQKVRFHEVGAVDSFIDIVGTAICFHYLKIEKAYVRSIVVGRGLQQGDHGEMPVPVPGAYELLKGFWIIQSDYEQEMVTPTGAAILKTLCGQAKIPKMKLETIGYGAGDRTFDGEHGEHSERSERGLLRVSLGIVA